MKREEKKTAFIHYYPSSITNQRYRVYDCVFVRVYVTERKRVSVFVSLNDQWNEVKTGDCMTQLDFLMSNRKRKLKYPEVPDIPEVFKIILYIGAIEKLFHKWVVPFIVQCHNQTRHEQNGEETKKCNNNTKLQHEKWFRCECNDGMTLNWIRN